MNTKSHRHLVNDYTSLKTLHDSKLTKEINSYINPSKVFNREGKYTIKPEDTNRQTYENNRQKLYAKDKDTRYIYNTKISLNDFLERKTDHKINTLTKSADYGVINQVDRYLYKNHHGDNIKLPKFYDRIRHV